MYEVIKMKNELTQIEFLSKAKYKQSIWDFCGNYFNLYLKDTPNPDEQLKNFTLLLEWHGRSDETFEIGELFKKEDCQNTTNSILEVVNKIIDNLVTENLEEEDFYKKLLEKILDDVLFSTQLEKVCSIVIMILNPKIPYFKLGQATKMENDKYKEISNSISNEIAKAYFALQYGYTQKTELASQLYNIVKEQKSDEERIVLIANILGYYNFQIKMMYDGLKKEDTIDDSEE